MLDLDHPRTPHVFAASRQLDLILDYCKRISLSGSSGRRFMLEVVRPAFAALRWLNRKQFGNAPNIAAAVLELEREAEALTNRPLLDADRRGGPADRCPACGGPPSKPSKYDPTPYCPPCLGTIMPGLSRVRSSDEGFGTDAI